MAKVKSNPTNLALAKKQRTKIKNSKKTKNENNQSKTNLKRKNVPLNWNLYVENQNFVVSTSKKVLDKFPKNLFTTAKDSKVEGDVNGMRNRKPLLKVKYIAIDCEMVGINDAGRDHMLARVSLVDENCSVLYDTFVKPTQRVVDYRTSVSGVREEDIINGRDFHLVQAEVHDILKNKVLVGHAVSNDLNVLYLRHNKKYIRDTSKFKVFREEVQGMTPSLRYLSAKFLGEDIQSGEHSSVEDACAAMKLYLKFRTIWEKEIREKRKNRNI